MVTLSASGHAKVEHARSVAAESQASEAAAEAPTTRGARRKRRGQRVGHAIGRGNAVGRGKAVGRGDAAGRGTPRLEVTQGADMIERAARYGRFEIRLTDGGRGDSALTEGELARIGTEGVTVHRNGSTRDAI